MNPACQLCRGACCETMLLDLSDILTPDALDWFAYHGKQEEGGIRLECKCSKLKNGKCSIWEERPNVCKTYEVGSEACLRAVRSRRSEFRATEIIKTIEGMNGKDQEG